MDLVFISFVAGLLTILAPCVLPLLPIIIGSSVTSSSIKRPIIITLSLALSIVFFTLLLKVITIFIFVPDIFWKIFSSVIILGFGLSLLFPKFWFKFTNKIKFFNIKDKSQKNLFKYHKTDSFWGSVMIGVSLGPVFASCSPTYFLILGTVLPASFGIGLINLLAYALGLALIMFLVSYAGMKTLPKLMDLSNPDGIFKKVLGIIFIIVAIGIFTGLDKKFETWILKNSAFNITEFEQKILGDLKKKNIKTVKKEENNSRKVSADEIISGGPPKDGIPSIDNPVFLKSKDVTFLNKNDEGIGIVDDNGNARFYPYRILVWHEIVNDEISFNGEKDFPIVITYCPLCKTGIVYEAKKDGEPLKFGTSGKLWQSNLLMYDRNNDEKEESMWSQVLGEAITGPKTGQKLNIFTSWIMSYHDWVNRFPETKVLSLETGNNRDYNQDPYAGYYSSKEIIFNTKFSDTKTHPKEIILGVEVDGNYLALIKKNIKNEEFTFGNKFIKTENDGKGKIDLFIDDKIYPYIEGFWFSWQAVHEETIIR